MVFLKTGKIDGFDVECDLEMIEGIRVYLDSIDEDLQDGDLTWVEMPLLAPLQRIDKDFGGWATAQRVHFDDGGTFDKIYGNR